MENLEKKNRKNVQELFSSVPQWKAFIQSAIEDGFGSIISDSIESPTAAMIFYGGIVIYAGEPNEKIAKEMIEFFDVQPAILAYSPFWNRILKKRYSETLNESTRYYLPFESHDRTVTQSINATKKNNIHKITSKDFDKLNSSLGWEHHKHHYSEMNDFLNKGNGFIYKTDQILSGASAYCRSSDYVECQVNTVEGNQKSGLATLTSAAFIEECYQEGLEIPWDAANEVSVKLGQKLGFRKVESYSIYELFPGE